MAFVGPVKVFPCQRLRSAPSSRSVVRATAARTVPDSVDLQNKAISTYKPREFRPPWWLKNSHAQTIAGLFLPKSGQLELERERVETSCGGFFDVDLHHAGDGMSFVILCHGLESNSRGPHTRRIIQAFADRGHTVAAMNFRGCSGQMNESLYDYHLGFTDDLAHYVQLVSRRLPKEASIYLTGFSLGANVVLKYIGEHSAKDMERFQIRGAAVQCVPFDPVACQLKLDQGLSWMLYTSRFLPSLKKKAIEKAKFYPDVVDVERVKAARTMGDFDDAYVAPVYGFADNQDYYRRVDTKPLLRKISVPTLIINAKDDPFFEKTSLPTQQDIGDAPVRLVYTDRGGHLGFIESVRRESYSTREVAQFISHVDTLQRHEDVTQC